jgi:hypothetical protein
MWRILFASLTLFFLTSVAVWGQVQAPAVQPLPLPGGDVIPPFGLFNQFLPGVGPIFDGLNADPHGTTNFRGVIAMGYTNGLATDNAGNVYQVITDIRVYQGDYIGAQGTYNAGGTTSAKSHGTFVEI